MVWQGAHRKTYREGKFNHSNIPHTESDPTTKKSTIKKGTPEKVYIPKIWEEVKKSKGWQIGSIKTVKNLINIISN